MAPPFSRRCEHFLSPPFSTSDSLPPPCCNLEQVASSSFEGGVEVSSVLDSSEYKKSTEILQLLRDNLTLWTSGDKPASEE